MRRAPSLLACALAFSSAACAGLLHQYDRAPNGLPRAESRLRDWLADGRADSAAARLARGDAAPGDDLLHALFLASSAYYAGEPETAGSWFERATELADERETKSVSRSALSLISNDLVLPYEPSRTERLFIPYYAGLARLRAGDVSGAAVEARRLSTLLERYESKGWEGEADLRASLRFFAATVFDLAGEPNDAAVAYRNAAALAQSLVIADDTLHAGCCTEGDTLPTGEVVVFIEQGFVAHRAPEALWVLLASHELYAFAESDGDGRARLANTIAQRVMTGEPPPRRIAECTGECGNGSTTTDGAHATESGHGKGDNDGKPYLLKVAWPVMRRPAVTDRQLELLSGDAAFPLRQVADVSSSAVTDFESERALILARTIARAALKTAIAKGAETKAEEKEEGSGKIVGLLANAGSVLLEQADTRSWHLLPSRLAVARIRLPAGRQPLAVVAGGRRVELGDVDVAAGGLSLMAARVW